MFRAYLIFLKERPAHIAVQGVGEVVVQVLKTDREIIRLFCVLDGEVEEVDEPGQGVLVHGLDVRQVSNGEEQNGAVGRDWCVAHSGYVDLLLRFFSNGL